MSDQLCLVLTTCPDEQTAERLAGTLVEQRLAACVSVGSPAKSTYPWQGRIECEREIPLTIKTSVACLPALQEALVALHPYEVPELLVVPVMDGLEAYMQWIRDWVE